MQRSFVNLDKIDNITAKAMAKTFFSDDNGFGKMKHLAITLLKIVTDIFNELDIDYFLISGTLLGQHRHNDFIPWDDDIDLLVDKKFIEKIGEIKQRCESLYMYRQFPDMFKFSYKTTPQEIANNNSSKKYPYGWPFLDVFLFERHDESLKFFNQKWEADKFYPKKLVDFVGLPNISIPSNVTYFLEKNHGKTCLTHYVSNHWKHKAEEPIKLVCIVSIKRYNELMNDNTIVDPTSSNAINSNMPNQITNDIKLNIEPL
jgi:hypothetical protein